jgi:hypothetical protein
MSTPFELAQIRATAFGANLIVHNEVARLLQIADNFLAQSLDANVSDDERAALQSASWDASRTVAQLGTMLEQEGGISA